MAIDERARHDLFSRLEEILGQEHAVVLMEHLPPVGWADVATKHDLDQLKVLIDARFDATEQRLLAALRGEIVAQTRTMIFSMATVLLGVAGVALTAANL